eukprot:200383_1
MGNENSRHVETRDNQHSLQTFEKLMSMGFDEQESWEATTQYQGDIIKAINCLTKEHKSQNINNLQNKTNDYDTTKYCPSDAFDKYIAKADISFSRHEETKTSQNIAKQI